MVDWEVRSDPAFRYGVGAVSKGERARAKWNWHGSGFRLWAPRGPEYGAVRLRLDGVSVGEVDLYASDAQPSAPVLARKDLPDGYHTLTLESSAGRVVLDTLEVEGSTVGATREPVE